MTNNNDKKGRKPQVWRSSGSSIKYIPLSSLKKFIEENEMEFTPGEASLNGKYEVMFEDPSAVDGFNSALKLLKDKFIHE